MDSKKQTTRKKIIMLIIILAFCVLLFLTRILYILLTDELMSSKRNLDYINSEKWNNELYPEGMPAFFRASTGNITAQNMGKSIYHVVTELIPEYNKELKNTNEEKIKQYYEENKEIIRVELGIITEKNFIKFMEEVNKINVENIEFESYYIDINSIDTSTGKASAKLYVNYKNCEELVFKIIAARKISNNTAPIEFSK